MKLINQIEKHFKALNEAKLDPVGKEDPDIDNDGDSDDADSYLANRRKEVSKAVNEVSRFKGSEIYPDWLTPKDFEAPVKSVNDLKKGNLYIILDPGMNQWQGEYKYNPSGTGQYTFIDSAQFSNGPDMDFSKAELLQLIADGDIWIQSGMNEVNSTASAGGEYMTPKAFGDLDDDAITQGGMKKVKESVSTYKKMMAEMYGVKSINEAASVDIMHALKDIKKWNKSNMHAKDLMDTVESIIKNLGYKVTDANYDAVSDHLLNSANRNYKIPEDPDLVKELYPLLESVSYRDYKKDPTSTPAQKVNKGINEVNKMLAEMEKIVANNLRLKTEMGVQSNHYWKSTGRRFAKINERMTRISNKLKELSQ